MRKIIYSLALASLLYACSEEEVKEKPLQNHEPARILPQNQIDQTIDRFLQTKNEFKWEYVDPDVVSSALVAGDSLLSIGYKPADVKDVNSMMAHIDINEPSWQDAKLQALSNIVSVLNRQSGKTTKAS